MVSKNIITNVQDESIDSNIGTYRIKLDQCIKFVFLKLIFFLKTSILDVKERTISLMVIPYISTLNVDRSKKKKILKKSKWLYTKKCNKQMIIRNYNGRWLCR